LLLADGYETSTVDPPNQDLGNMQDSRAETRKDDSNEMAANIEDEPTSCTPKFGTVGSPLTHKVEFQVLRAHIPAETSLEVTSQKSTLNAGGTGVLEATPILCSPVEEDPTFSIDPDGWFIDTVEDCQGEAQSPIVDLSVEDPTFSIAPDGQFIDTVEECQGEAEPNGEILLSEKCSNRVNEITSATNAARLITDERRFSRDKQVRNDEIELQSESVVATASSDINAEAGSRTQCMLGDQETSMDNCPVIAKVTTGSGRLQDLWQAKSARSVSPKRVQTLSTEWEYKHEEIDEKVLLELPLEIQRELRSSLRLKRPRPPKRTSISDFFQSQSSTSKFPK
jgi:hypothetical protein